MRRILWRSILPVFVAVSSGCFPQSDNPLSPPDPKGNDTRLLGTWISNAPPLTNGVTWLHFASLRDGRIEAVLVSPTPNRGNEVTCWRFHTTTIDTNRYMNLKPDIPVSFQTAETQQKALSAGYLFVKYVIEGDKLRIWCMTKLAPLEAAIRAGQLKGEVTPGEALQPKRIHLSDTSTNIIQFLSATTHGEVFEPVLLCRRVRDLPPKSE